VQATAILASRWRSTRATFQARGSSPRLAPFLSPAAIARRLQPDIVVPHGAQLADGSVELRKAAREQLENGADWIKVYMTHRSWVDRQGH